MKLNKQKVITAFNEISDIVIVAVVVFGLAWGPDLYAKSALAFGLILLKRVIINGGMK